MEPLGVAGRTNPWLAFVVVASAVFLTVLDLFVVNIALPANLQRLRRCVFGHGVLVPTAYAIGFAIALVPAGELGDLYGRRRWFSIGLIAFSKGGACGNPR